VILNKQETSSKNRDEVSKERGHHLAPDAKQQTRLLVLSAGRILSFAKLAQRRLGVSAQELGLVSFVKASRTQRAGANAAANGRRFLLALVALRSGCSATKGSPSARARASTSTARLQFRPELSNEILQREIDLDRRQRLVRRETAAGGAPARSTDSPSQQAIQCPSNCWITNSHELFVRLGHRLQTLSAEAVRAAQQTRLAALLVKRLHANAAVERRRVVLRLRGHLACETAAVTD
jgi:hypothetical protein